ncbi:NF-kappa-b inhibitor-like protein 1 [Plakobranchus ocellatus]|uniref:NF-kappa-b inhibitor-like protein 1 n=1 Tax=Plakobranchus ocellatus TaxID=259542 RepID=A0AAV4DQI7_9GAST|nr:NF-kappa-b inhibitor-like protein 1 [Plakobranchus ocellatus]
MSRKRKSQQHIFWRDKKARHDSASNASSSNRENPHTHDDEGEKLKRAREEMQKRYKPVHLEKTVSRLLVRKQRYEKKFAQLLSNLSGKSLTFACIPWPHVDVNCVADVLFCDLPQKKGVAYRKYLRSQQVRWHPDKFTQKFGEHLHPDHAPKIMARVKTLSQLLNRLESERTL